MYFSYFPKTFYSFDKSNGEFNVVTNIFTRVKLLKEILENTALYYKYEIQEGETPEIVAYKFYGDMQKHWLVLYANQIIDPKYDWILHYDEFNQFIINKYGSIEIAKTQLHHHEMRIEEFNSAENVIKKKVVQITDKNFNFKTDVLGDRSPGVPATPNDIPSVTTTTYSLADGTTLTETKTLIAVSAYDYEETLNESKRTINILNPDYAGRIENELKELLK
jgi:hypothetical protein